MRIFQVDTGREMRGGQWQVFYLAQALAKAGYRTELLAPLASPLYQRFQNAGIAVQPLSFLRLLKAGSDSDVVHVHTGRAHTLAVLAGLRRLVVSRRVAFPVRRGWASRWKYTRPAHFIAISQHVKSRLTAAGVKEDRISVIYDGVPLLAGSSATGGAVAPATGDPRKGSALAQAGAKLAGAALKFSANLREDLADARMLVYISQEEGLGSAVLLAMSAGVPVIASRVGGLPEIIHDGRNGLLTDNTPEAIAACMRRLVNDPAGAIEMGRRGRETVETRFTVDQMLAGTLRVYEDIQRCWKR